MICGGLSVTSFSHTKVGGDRLTQAKSDVTVTDTVLSRPRAGLNDGLFPETMDFFRQS